MPLNQTYKTRILTVHNVGPKMVEYLELIDMESLADIAQYDAGQLRFMINAELGRNHINAMGERVLADIIDAVRHS